MAKLFEDLIGGFGPDEGFGVPVVIGDVTLDGVFEFGDGFEDAAPDAPSCDGGEEAFDRVQPGGGCGRKVEDPSWVIRQPGVHFGMLVGSVVVQNDMDDFAGRDLPLHGVEELKELLMAMAFHAAADNRAVQNIEGGEERRGSVALAIMGHGRAFTGLQGQARLRAVERLDLAFLVDGQNHRMTGRVHVKTHHVLDFLDEGGIVGFLERSQAMRLKAVGLPDALHRAQAYADGFGDRSSGPMRGVSGRLGARQRQHFRHRLRRQRRLARFARLIAQQRIHPPFGVASLPAPHRGTASAALPRNIENGALFSRVENNPSPLHMLLRAVAILDDRRQAQAVFGREKNADTLNHVRTIHCFAPNVNPLFASVH